jgi:hypothetical protein
MRKKQKVGRPKVSEEIKKSMSISINLSIEEKQELENKANKMGLSLSSFIRFYLKQNEII